MLVLYILKVRCENILHFSVCSARHPASFRWLVVHFKTKTREFEIRAAAQSLIDSTQGIMGDNNCFQRTEI